MGSGDAYFSQDLVARSFIVTNGTSDISGLSTEFMINAGDYTNDNDQAYFLYATDDDIGTITNNGNLHFIYSIGGTDYVTDLGVAVTVDTVYRLKLAFDENRQIKYE